MRYNVVELVLNENSKLDGIDAFKIADTFKKIEKDFKIFSIRKPFLLLDFFVKNLCLSYMNTTIDKMISYNFIGVLCTNNKKKFDILKRNFLCNYKIVNEFYIDTIYTDNIFASYCISPLALRNFLSYEHIIITHHDFQTIYLISYSKKRSG